MRRFGLLALLLIEIALFSAISAPRFGSTGSLAAYFQQYFGDLLAQSAPILLLAAGMTLVLMTAGIDLSVGSMVALIACVMSSFKAGGAFWWTAVPVGLALGLGLGLANGLLIALLNIPPIIATLGTMILFRGLCFVVMGDLEKAPFVDVPGYEWLGRFSGALILIALVFVIGGSWFEKSRWRREILMLGGNRVAARYAGIPATGGFAKSMASWACWHSWRRLLYRTEQFVSASSLTGLELHVIVAVVLGGTGSKAARSLFGSLMGVFMIAVLDEGLRGASSWGDKYLPFKISHLEYLLLGTLLVAGVWLNMRLGRERRMN